MQKIHPILRDAYVTFSYFFSPILIRPNLIGQVVLILLDFTILRLKAFKILENKRLAISR